MKWRQYTIAIDLKIFLKMLQCSVHSYEISCFNKLQSIVIFAFHG